MEGMRCFLLHWDLHQTYQQQMRMDWICFPAPPMLDAQTSYTLANPRLCMDQSLTNLGLQSNRRGTVLPQQHTASFLPSHDRMISFLLSELDESRERIMEMEACLRRAEEERETWQRIAWDHEAMVASLKQTLEQLREASIGSSPDARDAVSCSVHPLAADEPRDGDARDAASCSVHPLAADEPRDGTGMGLCNAWGPLDSSVLLLPSSHLCACQLSEAFSLACPLL